MKKNHSGILLLTFVIMFLASGWVPPHQMVSNENQAQQPIVTLENDTLKVQIDGKTGCFTVTEKTTGQIWEPDPWEKAAGILQLTTSQGPKSINISNCNRIEVKQINAGAAQISYQQPVDNSGKSYDGISFTINIKLPERSSDMEFSITDIEDSQSARVSELIYPARHFSLESEVDTGMAVIPYYSGVVVPSYLTQMPSSQFGEWTDWWHQAEMIFRYIVYKDLFMPWYGIYSQKSGVQVILPRDQSVDIQYIQNYNDRSRVFRETGKEPVFPNILALSPIWKIKSGINTSIVKFHFSPHSDYVEMAKYYRGIVKKEGLHKSLRDKARQNPEVYKMVGDIYIHLFGGYPHRLNYPGMAFKFEEIDEIMSDLHNNLKVKKAFLTLWGTWGNYPPFHWPVNQYAGGEKGLIKTIELAKKYNYLITSYHNFNSMLPWDENYDPQYYSLDENGKPVFGIVWNMIDDKYAARLAEDFFKEEIETIGFNAIYSDSKQQKNLREFLATLGLPITSERNPDSESLIPFYHRLEGVSPNAFKDYRWNFIEVPLFNLVYHDAIILSGRWQFPDNDVDLNGDYCVRAMRNMLYGNETMFVTPVYAYQGIREYIRNATKVLAPLHQETGFEELVSHKFLSRDYNIQESVFGNGVIVTANLGLAEQKLDDGTIMPGYSFRIKHSDGKETKGQFRTVLDLN